MTTCISFVSECSALVIMAQNSHSGLYLCRRSARQQDEEHLDGVKLGKDAPEDWQGDVMNPRYTLMSTNSICMLLRRSSLCVFPRRAGRFSEA